MPKTTIPSVCQALTPRACQGVQIPHYGALVAAVAKGYLQQEEAWVQKILSAIGKRPGDLERDVQILTHLYVKVETVVDSLALKIWSPRGKEETPIIRRTQ